MKYEEYFDASVAEMEFHVFSSARPNSVDMESEAFSAGYLEKYYLNKNAHADKEALYVGINIIEDVENR